MVGSLCLLAGLLFIVGTCGYESGAPDGLCLNPHPSHDHYMPQTAPNPYSMTFDSDTYTPSQLINVTLGCPSKLQFKGFLIYAHRIVGDRETPVGDMVAFPTNKAKHAPCAADRTVGLTHANNEPIEELQFTWKSPPTNVGDIIFKYMLVYEFQTYWMGQTSDILHSAEPYTEPEAQVEQESFDTPDINWDECGYTKGCFLYPRLCNGADCKAAVTYTPTDEGFLFELYVVDNDYIAVGFSDDKIMGADLVHACTGGIEYASVQNGYNPFAYYIRRFRTGFSDMAVKQENGKLVCRFQRPRSMQLFQSFYNVTVDLRDKFYLFLAWGSVYNGTDVMGKHMEAPVTTDALTDLYDLKIVRGSTLHLTTRIHATLMLIAWVLFVGITTVVSRYYKHLRGESTICGSKYWFQIHRSCGVVAWILTAASFTIIFVKVDALSTLAVTHSYLGIAVMAACTLQVVAGMFRPDLKSGARPLFNIGHWLLGKASHILSALTIFYAYGADIIPEEQQQFGFITTGVWVVAQLVWEVVFEARRCCSGSSEKYSMKPSNSKSQVTIIDSCLLVLYIFTMLCLLAAQLVAVFIY